MPTLYHALQHQLNQNNSVALATVIAVKGSVPREVGAQMLIHPLGQHQGTVGGGCGEADVIRRGMDVLQSGRPGHVRVDLTEPVSLESTAVCGGVMDVYVEAWGEQAKRADDLALLERIVAAIAAQKPLAIVRIVRSDDAGRMGLRAVVGPETGEPWQAWGLQADAGELHKAVVKAMQSGRHRLLRVPATGEELFVEALQRPPRLVIVGAGHIAVPLCQLGALCDFSVTVIDDRAQYANEARFPGADSVIAADIQETVRQLATDEQTYVVLVTRGHTLDVACLLELIDRPLAYLGMIGSRRRVRAVFELLRTHHGIAAEKLQRVHAPIGLPIGAETPAEIAVCIMAEVINQRRQGPVTRALIESIRS